MSEPMTSPQPTPTPPASPAPPPAAAPSPVNSMVATYGMNQMIIALGAVILILADLVFVVFGPYGYSNIIWAVAASSLVLILLRSRLPAPLSANYQTILVALVGVAVLVGIRDIVLDVAFIPGRSLSVQYFLGLLGIYAGVIIMAFGAWRLWRSMRG